MKKNDHPALPHAADLLDLDQLTRDGLLDMMWGAWFSSREPTMQRLIFSAIAGDELSSLMAAQANLGGYPQADAPAAAS